MDNITLAIAKGRLGEKGVELFDNSEMEIVRDENSRKLIFNNTKNNVRYIFVKPSDVITYVVNGVADLGIVGKDMILEENKDVYEIMDLNYGKCRFAIAGFRAMYNRKKDGRLRIATAYPNYVRSIFRDRNQNVEIIELNGSVELAPLIDLSDLIVDIVETGSTLKANGLEVLEELDNISARLIVNKASYRFKYNTIRKIEKILGGI